MTDMVKRSGWNRQFESHGKINKPLMTGAEAAERDADNREQAQARKQRIQAAEEAEEEASIPPPSTAPAALTQSRAGRKRAPTMKALEAEMVSKRGRTQGPRGV
jgi:hypothetical protein